MSKSKTCDAKKHFTWNGFSNVIWLIQDLTIFTRSKSLFLSIFFFELTKHVSRDSAKLNCSYMYVCVIHTLCMILYVSSILLPQTFSRGQKLFHKQEKELTINKNRKCWNALSFFSSLSLFPILSFKLSYTITLCKQEPEMQSVLSFLFSF